MKILPPNGQVKQQALKLPDASLVKDLDNKDIKASVQETSVCLRMLCQNIMIYEPNMASDMCYIYLCMADAVVKQLEILKPEGFVLYADLKQAVLMVAGLRQQSSIQGQYTPIFNTTLLSYAASISYRLHRLLDEEFKRSIVINLNKEE